MSGLILLNLYKKDVVVEYNLHLSEQKIDLSFEASDLDGMYRDILKRGYYLVRVNDGSKWTYWLFEGLKYFLEYMKENEHLNYHQFRGNENISLFFDIDLFENTNSELTKLYSGEPKVFLDKLVEKLNIFNEIIQLKPRLKVEDFILIDYSRANSEQQYKCSFHIYSEKLVFRKAQDLKEYVKSFCTHLENHLEEDTRENFEWGMHEFLDTNVYSKNGQLRYPNIYSSEIRKRGLVNGCFTDENIYSQIQIQKLNPELSDYLAFDVSIEEEDYSFTVEGIDVHKELIETFIRANNLPFKIGENKGSIYNIIRTEPDSRCILMNGFLHKSNGGIIKVFVKDVYTCLFSYCSICKAWELIHKTGGDSNKPKMRELIEHYITSKPSHKKEIKSFVENNKNSSNITYESGDYSDVDGRKVTVSDYMSLKSTKEYVPTEEDLFLYIITSGGKSHYITSLLNNPLYNEYKFLFVTVRQSLYYETYALISGMKISVWGYGHKNSKKSIEDNRVFVCQYESLHKLSKILKNTKVLQRMILVADEFPAILDRVRSKETQKNIFKTNASLFINLLDNVRSIISASGTLHLSEVEFLLKYRTKNVLRMISGENFQINRKMKIYLEKGDWIDKLRNSLIDLDLTKGEKILILFVGAIRESKKFPLSMLKNLCQSMRPEIRFESIVGNDIAKKKKFTSSFEGQQEIVNSCDILTITHSLYVGVNLNIPFTHVFFYDIPKLLSDPQGEAQFATRSRKNDLIHLYLTKDLPTKTFTTQKEMLYSSQRILNECLGTLNDDINVSGRFEGSDYVLAPTSKWLTMVLDITFLKNKLNNQYLRNSIGFLNDNQFEVELIEDSGNVVTNVEKKEMKKLKDESFSEDVEEFITTSDIGKIQFNKLDSNIENGISVSKVEILQMKRFRFRNDYNYAGVISKELYVSFRSRIKLNSLRNLRGLLDVIPKKEDIPEPIRHLPMCVIKMGYKVSNNLIKMSISENNFNATERLGNLIKDIRISSGDSASIISLTETLKSTIKPVYGFAFLCTIGFKLFERYLIKGNPNTANDLFSKLWKEKSGGNECKLSTLFTLYSVDKEGPKPFYDLVKNILNLYFINIRRLEKSNISTIAYEVVPLEELSIFKSNSKISIYPKDEKMMLHHPFGDLDNFFLPENSKEIKYNIDFFDLTI